VPCCASIMCSIELQCCWTVISCQLLNKAFYRRGQGPTAAEMWGVWPQEQDRQSKMGMQQLQPGAGEGGAEGSGQQERERTKRSSRQRVAETKKATGSWWRHYSSSAMTFFLRAGLSLTAPGAECATRC
jgi:hypothetical protein